MQDLMKLKLKKSNPLMKYVSSRLFKFTNFQISVALVISISIEFFLRFESRDFLKNYLYIY